MDTSLRQEEIPASVMYRDMILQHDIFERLQMSFIRRSRLPFLISVFQFGLLFLKLKFG